MSKQYMVLRPMDINKHMGQCYGKRCSLFMFLVMMKSFLGKIKYVREIVFFIYAISPNYSQIDSIRYDYFFV